MCSMNNIIRGNHQTDLPLDKQILNISVNLARMGELVLKHREGKTELIKKFLLQTEQYLNDLSSMDISDSFAPTLNRVNQEFKKLKSEPISKNPDLWAERAITWADILQIRSKLA